MKTCPTCKKDEELTSNGYCKKCSAEYILKYSRSDKGKKVFKNWRNTKSGKERTKEINKRAYLKRKAKQNNSVIKKQKTNSIIEEQKVDILIPEITKSKKPLKDHVNDLNSFSSKSSKGLSVKEIGHLNEEVSKLLDYFIDQQEEINKVDKSCYDNKWRVENNDVTKLLLLKKDIEHWKKVIDILLKEKWWGKKRSRTMQNVKDFEQEYYKTINENTTEDKEKVCDTDIIQDLKQEIMVRKNHSSMKYSGLKPNPKFDEYFENKKLKKEYIKKYNLQSLI
jgi:hypothetical protein